VLATPGFTFPNTFGISAAYAKLAYTGRAGAATLALGVQTPRTLQILQGRGGRRGAGGNIRPVLNGLSIGLVALILLFDWLAFRENGHGHQRLELEQKCHEKHVAAFRSRYSAEEGQTTVQISVSWICRSSIVRRWFWFRPRISWLSQPILDSVCFSRTTSPLRLIAMNSTEISTSPNLLPFSVVGTVRDW
jgi:hypothetical protein